MRFLRSDCGSTSEECAALLGMLGWAVLAAGVAAAVFGLKGGVHFPGAVSR